MKILIALMAVMLALAARAQAPYTLDTTTPHTYGTSTYYGDTLNVAAQKLNSNNVWYASQLVGQYNFFTNLLTLQSNLFAANLTTQSNIFALFIATNMSGSLSPPYNFDAANAYTNTFGGLLTILGQRVQEGAGSATAPLAHAEGYSTASGVSGSHAEGDSTTASGDNAHSEGGGTQATAAGSHAEGAGTIASASQSHSEGASTTASGVSSHAEGNSTIASGWASHAGGSRAYATNDFTYVWSDDTDFSSITNKEYAVHALNGIRFVTGGAGLTVDGVAIGKTTVISLFSQIYVQGCTGVSTNFNGLYTATGNGYFTNNVSGWYEVPAGQPFGYYTNSGFGYTTVSTYSLVTNINTGASSNPYTVPSAYSGALVGNYTAGTGMSGSPLVSGVGTGPVVLVSTNASIPSVSSAIGFIPVPTTYSTNVTLTGAVTLTVYFPAFADTNFVATSPNGLIGANITTRAVDHVTWSCAASTFTGTIEGLLQHR